MFEVARKICLSVCDKFELLPGVLSECILVDNKQRML